MKRLDRWRYRRKLRRLSDHDLGELCVDERDPERARLLHAEALRRAARIIAAGRSSYFRTLARLHDQR